MKILKFEKKDQNISSDDNKEKHNFIKSSDTTTLSQHYPQLYTTLSSSW